MRPEIQLILSATCRIDTDDGGRASGFFVSSDGHLATSCHTIAGAKRIQVTWNGHQKAMPLNNAMVLAQDFSRDLAIVKLPYNVTHLTASDRIASVGDRFIMCGYPLGAEIPRVAEGTISSWPEQIRVGFITVEAQALNASVNLGNSGGPVCAPDGTVIGVVAAKEAADSHTTASLLCQALGSPLDPHRLEEVALALDVFAARFNAGIGFSIPANQIPTLLMNARRLNLSGVLDSGDVPTVTVSGEKLAAFQAACNGLGVSPVGPFSCNNTGEIWASDFVGGRIPPEERTFIPHELEGLLERFFEFRPRGGRFFLLGQSLCTYDEEQGRFRRYAWLEVRTA